MSNYNHTPGPWTACTETVSGIPTGNFTVRTKDRPGLIIIPVNITEVNKSIENDLISEAGANSRLISAAPDLLSVLKEAVDHAHVYNTPPVLVELFTAAINAATGVNIEQSIS